MATGSGLMRSMPKLRGQLGRAIVEKSLRDQCDKDSAHHEWYFVDVTKLPESIRSCCIQSSQDVESRKFLERARETSDSVLLQLYHSLASWLLLFFMSKTSVNGLLERGSMFIFSQAQLAALLPVEMNVARMIDLGAGDGVVTQQLAHLASDVYVTEMSTPMRWRLEQKGFKVLPVDTWHTDFRYDIISCLNLLDRCSDPLALLRQMRQALAPGGYLLIAMVLPYRPYVEFNSSDHRPAVSLPVSGASFEAGVTSLVEKVLQPLGLGLVRFTRLPYLCHGDLQHSYYRLDDVVLLVRDIRDEDEREQHSSEDADGADGTAEEKLEL